MSMPQLVIHVPQSLRERVIAVADGAGTSPSAWLRAAIRAHLSRQGVEVRGMPWRRTAHSATRSVTAAFSVVIPGEWYEAVERLAVQGKSMWCQAAIAAALNVDVPRTEQQRMWLGECHTKQPKPASAPRRDRAEDLRRARREAFLAGCREASHRPWSVAA